MDVNTEAETSLYVNLVDTSELDVRALDVNQLDGTTDKQHNAALEESGVEGADRIVYLNRAEKNEHFPSNTVKTSKYTKINFLPWFLYDRLKQLANFYFFFVGIGQLIPSISSTAGVPFQWFVLAMVLSVDAVFAGMEDLARHKADDVMNNRVTHRFNAGSAGYFIEITWREVRVGDILRIKNHEAVPADVLLLAVHEPIPDSPTGICFLETKSLDGETNLKVRQAVGCTFARLGEPSALGRLPGRVVFEQPNPDVNSFSGRFEPEDGQSIPLDLRNIALRGTTIRNIPYVYGLVLNTGYETKIMQNSFETQFKSSRIFDTVNKGVVLLLIVLILACLMGAIYCSAFVSDNRERAAYLIFTNNIGSTPFENNALGWFTYLGYYWILVASIVPITLYVSIAIVKGYQTYFLNRDIEMYHEDTDTPALTRNADLNDDLGQITHIFSDKTGTLTQNVMDFRKMSINGVAYGRGTTEIGRSAFLREGKVLSESDLLADTIKPKQPIPYVNFVDPNGQFQTDRVSQTEAGRLQSQRIDAFLRHLAVCHSVVLEHDEETNIPIFSASSPDELALVSGGAFFGYRFTERSLGRLRITIPENAEEEYEILEMIEFTSTRKRMSVIVRDPKGVIKVLCKGADSVMLQRTDYEQTSSKVVEATNYHLEKFASEGLRTLVIAERVLDLAYYTAWSEKYRDALMDLSELEKSKSGEPNKIVDLEEEIEKSLVLLGATAVEDRLQNGVPQALHDLLAAGIRVWVLTGDKEETAINIGYACQLLNNDMERIVINLATFPTPGRMKVLLASKAKELAVGIGRSSDGLALVIDGAALGMVFQYPLLKGLFLEVSQFCDSVICCRVSPKQKAEVVQLFKTSIIGCRTLAIGDGANDVGMIQEAHVGVGISGYEGMQAVNSSDFSIAQFRFLKRLLLVHGHWNYRRMAKLVLYVVYKNIMLYFALFVLAFIPGGSGTLFYNNMWINGFNVCWTSFQIILLGVLEQETSAEMAELFPSLYRSGANRDLFSMTIFAQWVTEGLFEATICALIPFYMVGRIDSYGNSYSLHVCGGLSYCTMITVCWVKLALNTVTWNFLMHTFVWGSIVLWYVMALIISLILPISLSDRTFPYLLALPEFYLVLCLCVVICLGRDFLWKAYKREFYPEYYHVVQEVQVLGLDLEPAKWCPPPTNPFIYRVESTLYNTINDDFPGSDEKAPPPHRGFAFSTPHVDDHYFNPLRDMILFPVNLVKSTIQTMENRLTRRPEERFREQIEQRDVGDQEVFEIERYQVFLGWGSSYPGHLLPLDPPRWTDTTMKYGASTFDTSTWEVDVSFGTDEDHWEYGRKFKDFLPDPTIRRYVNAPKLYKQINKLVGRCVRRRRWVRKRTLSVPGDSMLESIAEEQ